MGKISAAPINLNLQTKSKRNVSKTDIINKEVARLERANTYIIEEPEQECCALRNRIRIQKLKLMLQVIEEKERMPNNG